MKHKSFSKKNKKILSWILFIGWLLLIFFFSSQNGDTSGNLSNGILAMIEKITHIPLTSEVSSLIIRKSAHFLEYCILGVLTLNLLYQYHKFTKKVIFFSLIFCLLYAISDEVHQLFILNRTGKVLDVGIDFLGAMLGNYLYFYIRK